MGKKWVLHQNSRKGETISRNCQIMYSPLSSFTHSTSFAQLNASPHLGWRSQHGNKTKATFGHFGSHLHGCYPHGQARTGSGQLTVALLARAGSGWFCSLTYMDICLPFCKQAQLWAQTNGLWCRIKKVGQSLYRCGSLPVTQPKVWNSFNDYPDSVPIHLK